MTQISISLTEHETMIVNAQSMVVDAQNVLVLLQEISELLPTVSSDGEFQRRIASGGDQNESGRFVMKAQTFLTLIDVMSRHIELTYKTFIDMDELLAKQIIQYNLTAPNSTWTAEEKVAVQEDLDGAIKRLRNDIKDDRIARMKMEKHIEQSDQSIAH